MAGAWFETVAEAQRRAKRALPRNVYMALLAGSEAGLTLQDNVRAFDELGFVPHVAGQAAQRALETTVMGQQIALPVLISPTGVQAVHPEGEVAVARAAAARGTAIGLSSFASRAIEEVVAVNPKTFFQVYWAGSREQIAGRLARAAAAGAVGLIVTLDWSFSHRRDWGSPAIPEQLDARTMLKLPPGALRATPLAGQLGAGRRPPGLAVPNMSGAGRPHRHSSEPTASGCRRRRRPGTTCAGCASSGTVRSWSRASCASTTRAGRSRSARRRFRCPTTAATTSTARPASIRVLPPIAEAVGDQVEVLLDGGIRRGSDVVKALALGARAVMIGRAYLWGLAANGQAGVENVLDIIAGGIDSALLALARSSVHELSRDDLLISPGFTRATCF